MTTDNEKRRKEIVRDLLSKPHHPFSQNGQRLALLVGEPDYTPADEGEAPKDADW
jgi:hypothetical protein